MKNVLIFDYDGVLIDSFDLFMDHFLSSCRKYGFKGVYNKESFLKLFNGNMYESMFNMGLSKEQILKIVLNVKKSLIKDQEKIKFFDGIKESLENLSKNNILIVVTSNDTEVVERYFKSKKIDFFDEIVGSDKEPSKIKKIEYIKSKYSGENFYYFGDTTGDIIEGKNAGVKTVAVTWGWHDKAILKNEEPDYILESISDLKDFS